MAKKKEEGGRGLAMRLPTLGGGLKGALGKPSLPALTPGAKQRAKPKEEKPKQVLPTGPVGGTVTDLEIDSLAELEDLKGAFEGKKAKENARLKFVFDASFWRGIVFATAEDAEEFERQLGLESFDQWVDGYELARKLGLKLKAPSFKPPIVNVLDHWAVRSLEITPLEAVVATDDE